MGCELLGCELSGCELLGCELLGGGGIGEDDGFAELAFGGVAARFGDYGTVAGGYLKGDVAMGKRVERAGTEDAVGVFEAFELLLALLLRELVGFIEHFVKFGGGGADEVAEHIGDERGIDDSTVLVGDRCSVPYIGAVGTDGCQ